MFFSEKFHSGIEPQFYSQNSLFWPKMTSNDTRLPIYAPRHPPFLFVLVFLYGNSSLFGLRQQNTTSFDLLGVDLRSEGMSNSILELNQGAVMFISRKFYSGIEPQLLLTKHPFLTFLTSKWHTVTYIRPPALPSDLFHFIYAVLCRLVILLYGIRSYKRGSLQLLEVMTHLKNNPGIWPPT